WLAQCANTHSMCRPYISEGIRSISLIDVHTRRLVPYQQECDYMALSYVWGHTNSTTFDRTAVLPRDLPLTIEHALNVVHRLGKRYLWVDSLCIDQTDMENKMAQIAIMDLIYQGAFATIIALDGTDANSGLSGMGPKASRVPQVVAKFGSCQVASRCPSLGQQLESSPWMRRGWTYQEMVLSQRRIVFTQHQVYFRCDEMYCSE
ncbi:HET-domain-containing protein, partial [Mytilinidion resinicola]